MDTNKRELQKIYKYNAEYAKYVTFETVYNWFDSRLDPKPNTPIWKQLKPSLDWDNTILAKIPEEQIAYIKIMNEHYIKGRLSSLSKKNLAELYFVSRLLSTYDVLRKDFSATSDDRMTDLKIAFTEEEFNTMTLQEKPQNNSKKTTPKISPSVTPTAAGPTTNS
eukprot:gene5579-9395_t